MKSSNEIMMDYNNTINMTNELLELAEMFRKHMLDEAESHLNALGSCWKGDNAGSFIRKTQNYLESTSAIAMELEKIAQSIRLHAQIVYNAEMAALRIAQQRSFN